MLIQGRWQCLQDIANQAAMLTPEVRSEVWPPFHTILELMEICRPVCLSRERFEAINEQLTAILNHAALGEALKCR